MAMNDVASTEQDNLNSTASDPTPSRLETVEPRYRPEGSVTADTVCSAQRSFEVHQQHWRQPRQQQKKGQRRHRRARRLPRKCSSNDEASKATATTDSSLRGASNDYDIRGEGAPRSSPPQCHPHDAGAERYSRPNLPTSDGLGRFRSENPDVSRTSWPDSLQSEAPLQGAAAVADLSGQDTSPPTRILTWAWDANGDAAEEKYRTISPIHSAQLPARRVAASEPATPASERTREVGAGRQAMSSAAVEGETFLETQRDLLARLEALFVSIADERRHALLGFQREEALWRAVATERARSDLRAERADLEERARDRVAQQGPDAQAMEEVGLVRDNEEEKSNARGSSRVDAAISLPPERQASAPQGPLHRGRSVGWKLPTREVDKMRSDLRRDIDRKTLEVLDQENETLKKARVGVTEREEARTQRELQQLGERLASDGRDALADLKRELEDEAKARLEATRKRLKDEIAGALQRERDQLELERDLKIADAWNTARLQASEKAAALRDQAVRSTVARRDEAVKMLDEAAAKARDDLQTLLSAQEAKALEELRYRHSEDRRVSVERVRREGERQCLKEMDALAEDAREQNEAWLRIARRDLGDTFEKKGVKEGEGSAAPGLQVRAVKALDECGRICRRLVDLASKEAILLLQDSPSFGDTREEEQNNACEGRTGQRDERCVDCERLLRANNELKSLLERTTAGDVLARGGTRLGMSGTLETKLTAAASEIPDSTG